MVAPIGLFSANGAIGRVWFYKDQLTDKLGWATEPATSYTTRVQASLTLSPHFEAIELPSGQVLFANRGVGAPEFDGAVNWRVVSP